MACRPDARRLVFGRSGSLEMDIKSRSVADPSRRRAFTLRVISFPLSPVSRCHRDVVLVIGGPSRCHSMRLVTREPYFITSVVDLVGTDLIFL